MVACPNKKKILQYRKVPVEPKHLYLMCVVRLLIKISTVVKAVKTKYRQECFKNGCSYQQNWKEKPERFNLMCVVRLFFKFFIYNNFACIEHGYTNSMMLIQVWTQRYKYSTYIYMWGCALK